MRTLLLVLILAIAGLTAVHASEAGDVRESVVRVLHVDAGGARSFGSGTLIHKDAHQGVVLTCAHLFRGSRGAIQVSTAAGETMAAELMALDPAWDLAALRVAPPSIESVPLAAEPPRQGEVLSSCGYGRDGRLWCNTGQMLGYVRAEGTATFETLQLSGPARPGDSGGPVFNSRGELVAVLWGSDGRSVGGTSTGPIRRFLAALLPATAAGTRSPPAPGTPPVPERTPAAWAAEVARLRERLDALEGAVVAAESLAERVEEVERVSAVDSLRAAARQAALAALAERAPGMIERVLPGLLAAIGWSGPPAVAVMVAARLLAGAMRRRVRRRAAGRMRLRPVRRAAGRIAEGRKGLPKRPIRDRLSRRLSKRREEVKHAR